MKKNALETRRLASNFSSNYKIFDQLFQTVKERKYCFEHSFQKFFANINYTTDFNILGIIDLSGFQSKISNPRYFSEPPSENLKLYCAISIVDIQPVLLGKKSLT